MVHHVQKFVLAAQVWVEGVVAAVFRPDGPRGADVAVFGGEGVVAAFAVDLANRVDGREIDGVESHRRHSVQLRRGGGPGAVDRVALFIHTAGGARKQFVPGVHECLATLHKDIGDGPAGDQLTQGVFGEHVLHLLGTPGGDALGKGQGVVDKRCARGGKHRGGMLSNRGVEQFHAMRNIVGQLR